jgi:transcriptional regulator with XRE-family HTH domain
MKKRPNNGNNYNGQPNKLERAIGNQIRTFRKKMDLTIAERANLANLSIGMLSKIENGNASPSLSTLQSLTVESEVFPLFQHSGMQFLYTVAL